MEVSQDGYVVFERLLHEETSSWVSLCERLEAADEYYSEEELGALASEDAVDGTAGRRRRTKHRKKHRHHKKHRHDHHEDEHNDRDRDQDSHDEQDRDEEDEIEETDDVNVTEITEKDEEKDKDVKVVVHKRHKWAVKKIVRKKPKHIKNIPKPDDSTTHGIMIDAGSQGTRIHIYEFQQRMLSSKHELMQVLDGMKLSLPTTNSRWTNRLKPGLDLVASTPGDDSALVDAVRAYLEPHINFARQVLKDKSDVWHEYPIFLKATGGLRTLPTPDRVRLINAVRTVFHNETFNPFSFENERARVISGEEEAIYGWAAVNFLMGTLIEQTEGTGTVLNPQKTYGMLEMGGASTQIGFFENNDDVMANLFKLQIGAARHWNVYAHSFLYFGVNGAWSRLNAQLYDNGRGTITNPCLPAGSTAVFYSWIHLDEETATRYLPRSDPRSTPYSVNMINDQPDVEECMRLTRLLLRKETNAEWVEFSHDGDCSFAGVYQPPLPTDSSQIGGFIAASNYAKVWAFLKLDSKSSVQAVGDAATKVCNMTTPELVAYNSELSSPIDDDELFQYCFRSAFVFEILRTGYEFPLDYELVAADVINNQKLGWALGSILYEINILPWNFEGKLKVKPISNKTKKMDLEQSLLGSGGPDSWGDERTIHHHRQDLGLVAILMAVIAIMAMAMWMRERQHWDRRRRYEQIPSTSTH